MAENKNNVKCIIEQYVACSHRKVIRTLNWFFNIARLKFYLALQCLIILHIAKLTSDVNSGHQPFHAALNSA